MPGFFVGNDFLRMFSFPLLQGDATTALQSPLSIAVSHKMAKYFFGSPENAIGKTIRFENEEDLQVTAVFENPPVHSSLKFDFLRSWTAFVQQNKWVNNWSNTSPSTFILTTENTDPEKLEAKMKDFIYRYHPKEAGFRTELALQPFREKYLHSSFKNGYLDGGRIEYVRLFSVVAVLILLIACINFMNLATAQSVKRAKEVGLRKVIGAARSSLITQFIGETMMLTFFSILIAISLTAILLPAFNSLTGKQLSLPVTTPAFYIVLLALLVITGFVSGSYPAIFLSSLAPARVFKGSMKFGPGAGMFRKALVVFQFTVSIILVLGMIVIYRQMNYIQTKNLGYDRDNLVYIPIEGDLINKYQHFKEVAGSYPGIVSISKMRNSPTIIEHHTGSISWPGKSPDHTISFADAVVGYDFVKTMNLELHEGRDFSKSFGTDSTNYILNQTAAARMGFKDAVGKKVSWGNREGTIIGVLKDFHFNSIHQAIDPLIIRLDENWSWGTILIRIKAGQTKQAINALENICRQLNPKVAFTYQFSDEEYAKLYRSEQVVSKLSNYFALLAVFISCLGLFGLASFTAVQKTKEIGVRKVLGATVPEILAMLSANFLKLVAIAIMLAFPLAWLAVNQWLQNFAYKVDIEWWMFAITAAITICIALLTVSYESIRAALVNPVKSLRAE
jgi:ABC-type antimicrobial peptide transport system permease subunit